MANEVGIKLSAELDEASSVAKIKSQLGTIESSIKKEPIKPKIEFDQAQISNLAKSIQAAMAKSPIKAKIDIDVAQLNKITSTIRRKIESSLKDIKLPIFSDLGGAGKASSGAAAGARMPKGEALSQTSRQYDTIIQKVKEFNRLKGQDAGELIDFRTTSSGADGAYKATLKYQAGLNKTIDYVVAYNAETQEAIVTQTRFADALGKTEAAQQKQIENTKNFTQKYKDELKKVYSKAYNQDNPLGKEFSGSFDALFQSLSADIQGVGEVAGTEFMRGFKSKFADLNLALLEAKKAQWGATDFSSKDVTKQIVGAGLDIDIMEGRARAAGMATADVTAKVGQLRAELAGVSDMPGLQALGENVRIFGKEIEAVQIKAKDWNAKGQQKAFEIDTKQIAQLERLLANPALMNAQTPGLTAIREALYKVEAAYKVLRDTMQSGNLDSAAYADLENRLAALKPKFDDVTKAAGMFDNTLGAQKNLQKMSTELKTLQTNIDGLSTKYSAFMKNATARGMYENLQASSANADVSNKVQLQKEYAQFNAYLRSNGLDRKSMWDETKNNLSKFSSWFGIASVVTGGIRAFNAMTDSVAAVNKQMTELKKVTDETDATYAKFLKTAGNRSREIGVGLDDYVGSVAASSRLGNSMKDAQAFSEAASVYVRVGDEITNADEANKSLISTIQAFGYATNEAITVVDKFNAAGNRMAISSGGIGRALLDSASALSEANNSLDESIALIAAANRTGQDPAAVGTMWKTVSMRIRGVKTELEKAGLDTEGMAESTSKLRDIVKGLTGGFDVMVDDKTFKSTYEIIKGIGKEFEKLSDVDQAAIVELLAGKRQGNYLAGALRNVKDLEKSMEITQNSAGSAMAEHAKWSQSIEAAQLRATSSFQEFSNTIMSSSLISGYYDTKSGVLGFLTQLVDKLGAIPTLATAAAGLLSAKNFGIFGQFQEGGGAKEAGQRGALYQWIKSLWNPDSMLSKMDPDSARKILDDFVKAGTDLDDPIAKIKEFKATITDIGMRNYLENVDYASTSYENYTKHVDDANATTQKFSLSTKLASAGMKALSIAGNMAIMALIGAGIKWAFTAIGDAIHYVERGKENIQKLESEFANLQSEVNDVESELTKVSKRMDELRSKGPLSFIEKDELRTLQSTSKDLELQLAALKNLDTIKAKEIVDATTELYNKRFKNADVSESSIKWQRSHATDWAEAELGEGLDARALSLPLLDMLDAYGPDNLPAQLAAHQVASEQVARATDEVAKATADLTKATTSGAENSKELARKLAEAESEKKTFEALQNGIEKSLWERETDLLDVIRTIEAIPEKKRSKQESEILASASKQRNTLWQKLGPEKFVEINFNDIIERKEFAKQKDRLIQLGEAGKITRDIVNAPWLTGLVSEMNAAGVSTDALVEQFSSLVRVKAESDAAMNTPDALSESLIKLQNNFDLLKSAQEESAESGSVSYETYQKLAEAGKEYTDVLDEIDGRLVVNTDRMRELEDAQYGSLKAEVAHAKALKRAEYEKVAQQLSAVQDAYKDMVEAGADRSDLDKQKDVINIFKAKLEQIQKEIDQYTVLGGKINEATTAYYLYLKAKNAPEQGDKYDQFKEAKKDLKDALDTGKVGTDKFKNAVEMMLGEDALEGKTTKEKKELGRQALDKYNRYFKDTKQGSKNFIDDLVENGLATRDGKNVNLADNLSVDEIAEKLGIGVDAIEAAFGELEEYDWTVNWTEIFPEGTDAYNRGLEVGKNYQDGVEDGMAGKEPPTPKEPALPTGQTPTPAPEIQGSPKPSEADLPSQIETLKAELSGLVETYNSLSGLEIKVAFTPETAAADIRAIQNAISLLSEQDNIVNGTIVFTNADQANKSITTFQSALESIKQMETDGKISTELAAALSADYESNISAAQGYLNAIPETKPTNVTLNDGVGVSTDPSTPLGTVQANLDAADLSADAEVKVNVDGALAGIKSVQNAGDGLSIPLVAVDAVTKDAKDKLQEIQDYKIEDKEFSVTVQPQPSGDGGTPPRTTPAPTPNPTPKPPAKSRSVQSVQEPPSPKIVEVPLDTDISKVQAKIDSVGDDIDKVVIPVSANTIDGMREALALKTYIEALNPKLKVEIQTSGSVGLPGQAKGTKRSKDGISTVDEEGMEAIWRREKGVMEFGTPNGPRIVHLNAGDRVFNAEETRRMSRRKASRIIDGFSGGVNGGGDDLSDDGGGGGGGKTPPKTNSKKSSNWKKYIKNLFDWIEIRIAALQRVTDNWTKSIQHTVGYIAKNLKIDLAIKNVDAQIDTAQKGHAKYMELLATLRGKMKLKPDMVAQIEDGSIDVSKLKPKVREMVEEYKKWYDKANALQDSLADLEEQQRDLAKQKLDNIAQDYGFKVDRIDAQIANAEARRNSKIATGQEVTDDDYVADIEANNKKLNVLAEQRAEMQRELNNLVASGMIQQGSEDWHNYTGQIEELDVALLDVKASLGEIQKEIYDLNVAKLNYSLDALKHIQETSENLIDNKLASGKKINAADYIPMLAVSEQQIANMEEQIALARKAQEGLDVNSELYQDLESDIRSNESAIWDVQKAQIEWNNAVKDIPLKELQWALDAINAIKSSLEGLRNLNEAQKIDVTKDYYQSLVDNGMAEITNLENQNQLLREKLIGMDVESEKYQEILGQIRSTENAILDVKTAQEQWVDSIVDIRIDRIKKLQEELQKTNDKYERRVELEKALENLEKARQRTKMVYKEGQGFVYQRDEKAFKDAEKALKDVQHKEVLAKMDDAIDALEELKKDNNIYDSGGNLLTPIDWNTMGVNLDAFQQNLMNGLQLGGYAAQLFEQMGLDDGANYASGGNGGRPNVVFTMEDGAIHISGAGDPQLVANAVGNEFLRIMQDMPMYVTQEMNKM